MNSRNPYLPPSATQFAETPQFRTEFGIRLAGSLFWRVFLMQWLGVWVISALRFVALDFGRLMPMIISLVLALIPALSLFFTRRGILYFISGDRLALPAAAWRKFHWLLAAFYGVMAAWNLVAASLQGGVTPGIRMIISLVSLLIFFATAPRSLRNVTDVE